MPIGDGFATFTMAEPAIAGLEKARGPREAPEAKGGSSFVAELGKAVSALDGLQQNADTEVNKVAQGQGNLHEMAISLEKADIGMRLAMKVRNKVVEAYQEIMRMSV